MVDKEPKAPSNGEDGKLVEKGHQIANLSILIDATISTAESSTNTQNTNPSVDGASEEKRKVVDSQEGEKPATDDKDKD